MSDQPLTLAVFQEFQRTLLDRFDRVDARLGGMDGRFGVVAGRFDALDKRLDGFQKNVGSRFDEIAGQFDAFSHRLLRLEDEYVLIKGTLKSLEVSAERLQAQGGRLEDGHRDLLTAVHRLDERASRTEKRLDELVAGEPRYALRDDFHELKAQVQALLARIDALQKRVDLT
jgi:chromosome segregation ATPase